MPTLSIITINYNNRDGLEKTIQSVICQTYKDYEYIVIDGGSTDGSKEMIDKYLQYFSHAVSEPDKGIYNAMNKGIKAAHGEYLQFLNSGDCLIAPDTLQQIFDSKPTADIISSHSLWIQTKQIAYAPENVTLDYLYEQSMNHQSTFIRRSLFDSIQYDESLRIAADYKFFLQTFITRNVSYQLYDFPTVYYDETGVSSTRRQESIQERNKILTELLPPFIIKDCETRYLAKQREAREIKQSKYKKRLRKIEKKVTLPLMKSLASFCFNVILGINGLLTALYTKGRQ